MTDEEQPPLTLSHQSFVRGELEGKPCVVIYDASTDKTTVISEKSRGYIPALAALTILEQESVPVPKSLSNPKTIVKPRQPKLILPGSNASN